VAVLCDWQSTRGCSSVLSRWHWDQMTMRLILFPQFVGGKLVPLWFVRAHKQRQVRMDVTHERRYCVKRNIGERIMAYEGA
jgi:hypothetical protein